MEHKDFLLYCWWWGISTSQNANKKLNHLVMPDRHLIDCLQVILISFFLCRGRSKVKMIVEMCTAGYEPAGDAMVSGEFVTALHAPC